MKIISAEEAALQIADHATLAAVGMGLSGWPDEVAAAIADRYEKTGHPKGIRLKQGSALGDFKDRGPTRLGLDGLVAEWTGAHVGAAKKLIGLAAEGKLACFCLPQGIIVNQWREIAAGRPGLLTKIGLHTFVDPRYGGGAMNATAQKGPLELVEFRGEEYLFYPSFPVDVAVIRGTYSDQAGNITFDHEPMIHEGLAVASAVKRSGGIVIVQVEYLAENGALPAKEVRIPGRLVDYVVVATNKAACWQSPSEYYDPSLSGERRRPVDTIQPLPLDERKVIARRCAAELGRGGLVNLGMGIPVLVGKVAAEENCLDGICLSTESGIFGGVSSDRPSTTINPDAFIDHGAMFDIIDGGGLDMTCLGMGELDESGSVNVSRFGTNMVGPGGFIDLTQSTRKVVFCGTLMGKSELRVGGGTLEVVKEGNVRKLVKEVQQISFNGRHVPEGQQVVYITERCVLKTVGGRLTVVEVAPGIDMERDVLERAGFPLAVSPEVKVMDPGIFSEHWGGLKELIDKNDDGRRKHDLG